MQFTVNGAIFKGKMRVVFVGSKDTYRIECCRDEKFETVFKNIYDNNLAETIDEIVEKPAKIKTQEEYHEFLTEKKEPFIKI